jgi:hypothetical protein
MSILTLSSFLNWFVWLIVSSCRHFLPLDECKEAMTLAYSIVWFSNGCQASRLSLLESFLMGTCLKQKEVPNSEAQNPKSLPKSDKIHGNDNKAKTEKQPKKKNATSFLPF